MKRLLLLPVQWPVLLFYLGGRLIDLIIEYVEWVRETWDI